jgi:plasmid stabilization system protein ParE
MTSYKVIWSPNATLTYYQILRYLDEKWTSKEIDAFVLRTEEAIDHICENPLLFPYSVKNNIHRCVIVKQVSLFYQINNETIELLIFWDNRQNPVKLKL